MKHVSEKLLARKYLLAVIGALVVTTAFLGSYTNTDTVQDSSALSLPDNTEEGPNSSSADGDSSNSRNALQNGLQAYYRFDGANFSSGYSLSLDGEDEWADTSGPENLTEYSVSVWFKAESDGGERHIFQDSDGAPSGHSHGRPSIGLDPSALYFTGGYNGTSYDKAEKEVNLGEWYHAVLVSNGPETDFSAYVNGDYIGDTHWTEGSELNLSNTTIGARPEKARNNPDQTHHFDGLIDEVQVYNRSLTDSEVGELYDNERVMSDLTAHYGFNGGPSECDLASTSGCLQDSSVKKNHATPQNFSGNDLNTGSGWSTETFLKRPVVNDYSGEGREGMFYGGHDGQLQNFDFNSDSGWMSEGLNFDGEDDYVEVGDEDSFDFNSSFSISMWVKWNETDRVGLVSKGDAYAGASAKSYNTGFRNGFWFEISDGTVRDGITQDGYSPSIGEWEHYLFTWDGTSDSDSLKIYVDGELWNTGSSPVNETQKLDVPLIIGKDGPDNDYYFNGSMSDVRMYNRSLSASESKSIYEGQKVQEGLVGEWRFEEGNGRTVYDTSSLGGEGLLGTGTIDFDGEDDYVLTDWTGVHGNESRTVSLWFKGSGSKSYSWVKWGDDVTGEKYHIRAHPGDGTCYLRVENAGGQKYGDTAICDNRWHHLAVVLPENSSSVQNHKLYVDGRKEAETFGGDQNLSTSNQSRVHLGYPLHHHDFLKGKMDEVRIYNRSLSAEEIRQLAFRN